MTSENQFAQKLINEDKIETTRSEDIKDQQPRTNRAPEATSDHMEEIEEPVLDSKSMTTETPHNQEFQPTVEHHSINVSLPMINSISQTAAETVEPIPNISSSSDTPEMEKLIKDLELDSKSTQEPEDTTTESQLNQLPESKESVEENPALPTDKTTPKRRPRQRSQNKIEIDEKRRQREREQEARYEGVEIDRKLYIGGRLASQNYEWLTETFGEMGYILNVSECSNYFEEENRFTYKRINISDACESNISRHFDDASNFIHQGLNNDCCVFVHCREGKSRSIAIVIAYFMIKRDWTLEKAYQHIVNVLPWKENINQGFKLQLMNLDLKNTGRMGLG
jgi:hypothetical protein